MKKRIFTFVLALLMVSTIVLSATPAKAEEDTVTLRVHYYRPDGIYDGWELWAWDMFGEYEVRGISSQTGESTIMAPYLMEPGSNEIVATLQLPAGVNYLGYIIRQPDWTKDVAWDQCINLTGITSGTVDFYVTSGVPTQSVWHNISFDDAPSVEELIANGFMVVDGEIHDLPDPFPYPLNSVSLVGEGLPGIREWDVTDPEGCMTQTDEYTYVKKLSFTAGTVAKFKIVGNCSWDDTYLFGGQEEGAVYQIYGTYTLAQGNNSKEITLVIDHDCTLEFTIRMATMPYGSSAHIGITEPYIEPELPSGVESAYVEVFASLPADWKDAQVSAWSVNSDVPNFGNWHGKTDMYKDGNGIYHAYVPYWIDHLMISTSDGAMQTEVITVEPGSDHYINAQDPTAPSLHQSKTDLFNSCHHDTHDKEGNCTFCLDYVGHQYDEDNLCSCGLQYFIVPPADKPAVDEPAVNEPAVNEPSEDAPTEGTHIYGQGNNDSVLENTDKVPPADTEQEDGIAGEEVIPPSSDIPMVSAALICGIIIAVIVVPAVVMLVSTMK